MKRVKLKILIMEKLNYEVFKLVLEKSKQHQLDLKFCAGQYLDIILPDNDSMSFSIASSPENTSNIELHIKHNLENQRSNKLINFLKSSEYLEIEIPKGDCFICEKDINRNTRIVLVAASTGFAQIKSMVEFLLTKKIKNQIHIYWGVRQHEDLYLKELPTSWAKNFAHVKFHYIISDQTHKEPGRTGLLHQAINEDFGDLNNTQIYASGSPEMVFSLVKTCQEMGLPHTHLHSDVFSYIPQESNKIA